MENIYKIYKEIILEHYKNPHNYGLVRSPDFKEREENIFCGDWIEVSGKLQKGRIKDIKFRGAGCVISQAAASMLTDLAQDKTPGFINKLGVLDVIKLIGANIAPARMKCAEVSLLTLKKALSAR